jgi:hypothetical protein
MKKNPTRKRNGILPVFICRGLRSNGHNLRGRRRRERGPGVHEFPAFFEKVGPPISGFRLVFHDVRESGLRY